MAFFGIGGIVILLTIMGLIIPSSVKISRGIVIQADSALVYEYLVQPAQWKQWMPWLQNGEGLLVQESAITSGPGASVRWKSLDGKNAGTLMLTTIKPGELGLLHEFKNMNPANGGFRIRRVANSNRQTEVQWFLEYRLKWYPWERFSGIFMDHMIGPVLEQALQQLGKITTGMQGLPS